jgi:hypothetical protein
MNLALTPDQRMAKFYAMQKAAFERLEQNPEALERFWRRNLSQRAVPHAPDAFQ